MFTRLLLAIDDSSGSEVATAFATALARHHGASVHVFHVNEYLVGGRGLTLRTQADATALLAGVVHELRAAGITTTGSSVRATYREVPRRIAAVAHERGCDAIVLGSERHRRMGRLFSPNVCARTSRLTSLPVVTAPSPLDVSAAALLTVDDAARQQFERPTVVAPELR
jgi:nucleotide-binding universal stress UspA family protein